MLENESDIFAHGLVVELVLSTTLLIIIISLLLTLEWCGRKYDGLVLKYPAIILSFNFNEVFGNLLDLATDATHIEKHH